VPSCSAENFAVAGSTVIPHTGSTAPGAWTMGSSLEGLITRMTQRGPEDYTV